MPTTPPPPARRSALQWLDVVAGIGLTLVNALLGTVMLAQLAQLSGLDALCAGIPADGSRCDPGFLNTAIIIGYGIVIFAWFLGLGVFIMRAVQRRVAFWVPLVGGAVILAAFYVVAILLSSSYQPAA